MYNAYDENLYRTLSTHERHLHVVFLSNEKDANDNYLPRRMIADITHYAITTVRTYEKCYEDLLEEARKIFYGIKRLVKGIVDKVKKPVVTFTKGSEKKEEKKDTKKFKIELVGGNKMKLVKA